MNFWKWHTTPIARVTPTPTPQALWRNHVILQLLIITLIAAECYQSLALQNKKHHNGEIHEPYCILFSRQGARSISGWNYMIGDFTSRRYVAQCLTNASFLYIAANSMHDPMKSIRFLKFTIRGPTKSINFNILEISTNIRDVTCLAANEVSGFLQIPRH